MGLFPGFRLRRAGRRLFGWRLRPAQLTAMRALLRGRDALVVLPTGGGKSAVYQVPAALLPGPTVVVSPLLALQHDQLAGLNERGEQRLRAVRVSSAETPKAQAEALAAVAAGRARLLFITPEQLARPDRLAEVAALRPALVAVDEAHCISTWGHDFRPDYLALGGYIEGLGRPPVVALTATASPPVREDIVARLRLRRPRVVVGALDRPNLYLSAEHCASEEHRRRRLKAFVEAAEPPGIVYVPTRRAAEELAGWLPGAQCYHGGLAAGERARRHEEFLADKVPVMVATSAFGMGIDKPNIRWVLHAALPDSPDSYLQEIGRAGRDGEPARALLLHRGEDVALQRYFVGGPPDPEQLRDLAALLRQGLSTRAALAEASGLSPRRLGQLLGLLEEVGTAGTPAEVAKAAMAEVARRQAVQRSRTDMMRSFAEGRTCRTRALLGYFGDQLTRPCGHCDNCAAGAAATTTVDLPAPLQGAVRHRDWGPGTVLGYEGDRMTVLFDRVGYKTLSVQVVREQNLLSAGDVDVDAAG